MLWALWNWIQDDDRFCAGDSICGIYHSVSQHSSFSHYSHYYGVTGNIILEWIILWWDTNVMIWHEKLPPLQLQLLHSTLGAAAGWLEFLNWIWCLTFESSGSSAVQCTMVLMLNSGVKAPLPYQLSMSMLFAHFLSCFSLAMTDTEHHAMAATVGLAPMMLPLNIYRKYWKPVESRVFLSNILQTRVLLIAFLLLDKLQRHGVI